MSGLRVVAALALALVLVLVLPQRAAASPVIITDIANTQLCYTPGQSSTWSIVFSDTSSTVAESVFRLAGFNINSCDFISLCPCAATSESCTTYMLAATDDGTTIQVLLQDTTGPYISGTTQTVRVISIGSVTANGVVGTGPYYAVMDAASSSNTITVTGTFNSITFMDGSVSHPQTVTEINLNPGKYGSLNYAQADDGKAVTITVSNTNCVAGNQPTVTATVNLVYLTFASFTTNPAPIGASRSVVLKTGAAQPTFTVGAGTGYNQFTLTESAGGTISTPLVTPGCTASAGCSSSATTFAAADDGKTISVTVGFAMGGTTSTVTEGTPTSGTGSVTIVFLSETMFTTSPALSVCGASLPCTVGTSYLITSGAGSVSFTFVGTGFDTAQVSYGATNLILGGTANPGITISTSLGPADSGLVATPLLWNSINPAVTINTMPMTVTLIYLQETTFSSTPAYVQSGGTYYIVISGDSLGTGIMVTLTFQGTGFDTVNAFVSGAGSSSGSHTMTGVATGAGITVSIMTVAPADNGKTVTPSLYFSANSGIAIPSSPSVVTLVYLQITAFAPAAASGWTITNSNYIVVKGASPPSSTFGFTFTGVGFDTAEVTGTASFPTSGATVGTSPLTTTAVTVTAANNGATLSPTAWFSGVPGTTTTPTPAMYTLIYLSIGVALNSYGLYTTSPAPDVCSIGACTIFLPNKLYTLYTSPTTVTAITYGTGFDTAVYKISGAGGISGLTTQMSVTPGMTTTNLGTILSIDSGKTLQVTVSNSASMSSVTETQLSGTGVTAQVTLIYLSLLSTAVTAVADNSMPVAGPMIVATYAIGLSGGKASTASFTITGTGFDSARLLDQGSNTQVGGLVPPGASSCVVSGGGGNAASVTCTPHAGGVTLADDGSAWYIKVWHSANPAITMRSDPVRIVVFGIMTQPANQIILATGMSQGSAIFSVTPTPMMLSNAYSYTPTYSYNWQQKSISAMSFTNTVPAQVTSSIVVTSDGITPGVTAMNGQVAASHQDIFQVQITVNTVTLTSSTASIQVMICSYPGTSGKLNTTTYSSTTSNLFTYDYYGGGAPWLSTSTSEPQYQQQYQVTNVFTLDNTGAIQASVPGVSCNLVLRDGTAAHAVLQTTSLSSTPAGGSGTLTVTFTIAAGPSDPPLPPAAGGVMYTTYDLVTQLNGGYLEIDCNAGLVYGQPQNPPALNIRYPPKVSPELPGLPPFTPINRYGISRWAATPSSFGNTGYSNFPEPGAFLHPFRLVAINRSIHPALSLSLSRS